MSLSETEFWSAINVHFGDTSGDRDEQLDALGEWLEGLDGRDVVEFQRRLNDVMARAYVWELIGAACFLGCGQSDDGFEDFRAWLVAQGKETYERVLQDVNVLATMHFDESPTEEWHFEELHMLPGELGGEQDHDDWPYLADPESPSGEQVELTQAALRDRFPKLWDHFGDAFMIGIE